MGEDSSRELMVNVPNAFIKQFTCLNIQSPVSLD